MIQVETEVAILASIDRVWEVLTDFSRYQEWNPIIPSIRGKLALGSKITMGVLVFRILFGPDFFLARQLIPVGGKIRSCESFYLEWAGGLPGILYGRHYFKLKQVGSHTKVTHNEEFTGIFSLFLGGILLRKLAPSYQEINQALLKRSSALGNS